MKNLLTYISPAREFNAEHRMLVKIQIDNGLRLGWDRGDIILATNFDYEYNGVRAMVLPDRLYCQRPWTATKIFVIDYLLENNLLSGLTWYHDFDTYQLNPFTDIERDMAGADLGLAQYGRMPRLCSASMFFYPAAREFIAAIKRDIVDNGFNEEYAIMRTCGYDEVAHAYPTTYNVRKIDITYALHRHNFGHVYARAKKPVMAAHFHATPDKYDLFVRGNNKAHAKIIPDGLVSIFNQHGFTG